MRTFFLILACILLRFPVQGQQVADSAYSPLLPHPDYPPGKGPVICIDEGHFNFHTKEGRYYPFARLLERDGYLVESTAADFSDSSLRGCRVLVIANALNEANTEDWYLPTPSAFTPPEIVAVKEWVEQGGSLFLIADHMPFAGAASDLATAFGFGFTNGFATDTAHPGPTTFSLENQMLISSEITRGRDAGDSVNKVVSFTGQAFRIPEKAQPVLVFSDGYLNLLPDTAWVFDKTTRIEPIAGWSQGAVMEYGRGRLAVFGEAAMFSAQLAGPNRFPAGMNAPYADQNYRLLLNVIRWLVTNQ